MTCGFRVTIDRSRGLMRYALNGFFDESQVAALDAERRAALIALGTAPNQHVTLIDVSDCQLQSQVVVEMFRGMMAEPRGRGRRLAMVVGSSLVAMQARRIAPSDRARIFTDTREAEAWLAAADTDSIRAAV